MRAASPAAIVFATALAACGKGASYAQTTAKSLLPGDVQCGLGSSSATCTIKVCIEGRDGGCGP